MWLSQWEGRYIDTVMDPFHISGRCHSKLRVQQFFFAFPAQKAHKILSLLKYSLKTVRAHVTCPLKFFFALQKGEHCSKNAQLWVLLLLTKLFKRRLAFNVDDTSCILQPHFIRISAVQKHFGWHATGGRFVSIAHTLKSLASIIFLLMLEFYRVDPLSWSKSALLWVLPHVQTCTVLKIHEPQLHAYK